MMLSPISTLKSSSSYIIIIYLQHYDTVDIVIFTTSLLIMLILRFPLVYWKYVVRGYEPRFSNLRQFGPYDNYQFITLLGHSAMR